MEAILSKIPQWASSFKLALNVLLHTVIKKKYEQIANNFKVERQKSHTNKRENYVIPQNLLI